MRIHKFFRFNIEGDELDPNAIKDAVNLPCDVFIKGETVVWGILQEKFFQKTNRWLYSTDLPGRSSVSAFLTRQLESISKNLPVLKDYIEKYDSHMELVLYAGNETEITLNLKQIQLLEKIGVEFSISFC